VNLFQPKSIHYLFGDQSLSPVSRINDKKEKKEEEVGMGK
jgi:hypothetical protein